MKPRQPARRSLRPTGERPRGQGAKSGRSVRRASGR